MAPRKHKPRGLSGPGAQHTSPTESGAARSMDSAAPLDEESAPLDEESTIESNRREDEKTMATYGTQTEQSSAAKPLEGVAVVGEAVRGVTAESAELLIEITANANSAAQALRDNHVKGTQLAQALGTLGVQGPDMQVISLNVFNIYSQVPGLAAYPGIQQIAQGAMGAGVVGQGPMGPLGSGMMGQTPLGAGLFGQGAPNPGVVGQGAVGAGVFGQAGMEVQFGSYSARKTLRVIVRDAARAGEVVDSAVRAGASVVGAFAFRVNDEASARRGALEAATKDARAKAEALAIAAGRQLGDAVAVTEEIVASNGTYAALRSALPFAFGAGTPQVAGDLEYYARVSARFRFQ